MNFMVNDDKRYITIGEYEKKNAFIYKDVKRDVDAMNTRIDKYSDKTETLDQCITEIKISLATIISNQKNDKISNERILDLLTSNIKANEEDIKENKKRINVFSGAILAITFLFTYLWNALKGQ